MDTNMLKYLQTVKAFASTFAEIKIVHIPREENRQADLISRLAFEEYPQAAGQVILEVLDSPTIATTAVMLVEPLGWMAPIWNYISEGALPKDRLNAIPSQEVPNSGRNAIQEILRAPFA